MDVGVGLSSGALRGYPSRASACNAAKALAAVLREAKALQSLDSEPPGELFLFWVVAGVGVGVCVCVSVCVCGWVCAQRL